MRNIEDYAKEYQKESFEKYQVKYRRKMLLERLEYWTDRIGHPLRVLEVGIGLEPLFLYAEGFEEWTCVEPSLDFAGYAELVSPPNVRVVKGCIEESTRQLKGSHFDFIIVSSLLHEVEEPDRLLAAIREVSDPGTVVHVNVPNANSMHRLLAREAGLISTVTDFSDRNRQFQQHHVFDADSLKELVSSQGGICVAEGSYFVKPFSHEQMQAMMDHGIISEKVLDGLYNLCRVFPENGSEIYIEYRAA